MDRLERAREDVRRASDRTEDETVREQLRSIDEGLKEVIHSSKEDASDTDAREVDGDVTTRGTSPTATSSSRSRRRSPGSSTTSRAALGS